MKKSEFTKSNKFIAEFMFDKKSGQLKTLDCVYGASPKAKSFKDLCMFDEPDSPNLKYHESWDWLMPVLNKIGNIISKIVEDYYNDPQSLLTKKYHNSNQMMENTMDLESSNVCKANITKVYKMAIIFIKWYNKNK
jgi:hypothetical protein